MSTYREAKLTPWYHQPKPRCIAEIKRHDNAQCLNSASYEDLDGKSLFLCKPHADMADFPTRRISARKVQLDG